MMRILGVFFLSIIIFSGSFKEGIIRATFKLNQHYIANNLCINKNEPKLECNGKCYLKTKLTESKKQKEETPYPPPTENNERVVLFVSQIEQNSSGTNQNKNNFLLLDEHILMKEFATRLLRPPQC